MNSMLAIQLPDTYEGTLLLGAQVFTIGIATVFAVLVLIWGILSLFGLFSQRGNKAKTEKSVSTVTTASPAPVATASDNEIIAVIAAAIAMAESEHPGTKFRVVSFNRK